MKKTILFRADGNSSTGLGHLYRLFALVEMVKEVYDVVFVTKSSSTLEIIPKDYKICKIPNDILLQDEANWIAEVFDPKLHALILDGYQFKSSYQKSVQTVGFKHLYVDDLEEYEMFADIIVNHSSASKKDHFKISGDPIFALGTDYALLRPLFLKEAKQEVTQPKEIKEVFVCFGGADKFNLAQATVNALLEISEIQKINVILGAASDSSCLSDLKLNHNDKLEIYRNLSEKALITVMKKSDLAIVPTSTIFYEIACVKIPTISGYFVENQIGVYNWFKSKNCFYGVDDFTTFDFTTLKNIIGEVKHNAFTYVKNQSASIDGEQRKRFLKLFDYLN